MRHGVFLRNTIQKILFIYYPEPSFCYSVFVIRYLYLIWTLAGIKSPIHVQKGRPQLPQSHLSMDAPLKYVLEGAKFGFFLMFNKSSPAFQKKPQNQRLIYFVLNALLMIFRISRIWALRFQNKSLVVMKTSFRPKISVWRLPVLPQKHWRQVLSFVFQFRL